MADRSPSDPSVVRSLTAAAFGRRPDWRIPLPALRGARPGLHLVGPLAIVLSVVVGWFAFAGASGEDGSVALGLFVGASAITLMAWSFVLAVRIPSLEPLFGGLDRMYQAHRWAGTLAVVAMFLHVRLEPEVEGGIRGASRSVADTAEGLAGFAEYSIYTLVALSLIRWVPYRFWRLSHKLLGIPFAFASWHFFTAEKTYANGSAWGWYFGFIMISGLAAFVARVVVRDALARGTRYTVVSADTTGSTLQLELAPKQHKLQHRTGQFAVIKIQERGLSEPHVFTIASSPDAPHLRFFVRDLGDWTRRIQQRDLVGSTVLVEGPYGTFEPHGSGDGDGDGDGETLWIAGGVGITPFLSAIDSLEPRSTEERPTLVYCVPNRDEATAIAKLEQAHADGRVRLEVLASDVGQRFNPQQLAEITNNESLRGTHVAVCGPAGLVRAATKAVRAAGATIVETEAFDIRSGIGPDLSRELDELVRPNRKTQTTVPT